MRSRVDRHHMRIGAEPSRRASTHGASLHLKYRDLAGLAGDIQPAKYEQLSDVTSAPELASAPVTKCDSDSSRFAVHWRYSAQFSPSSRNFANPSTLLNESGWAPDAIERQLSHKERDKARAAKISESGVTQSRSEYAAYHLGEDIAFLNSAHVNVVSLGSMPMGETAMVGSESDITTKGSTNLIRSREMLTLRRERDAWKIQSIRWQSGPRD